MDEKSKRILQNLQDIMGNNADTNIVDYIRSFTNEEDFDEFIGSIDKESTQAEQAAKNIKKELFSPNEKSPSQQSKQIKQTGKSKKTKFTNLYDETSNILRKGRHPCNCQGTQHDLINNCLECGRIVCKQEGSGPCFFCDKMVCTIAEMEILQSNSKEANRLSNQLKEQKMSKEWKQAIENRNKLIEKDRLGLRKTNVIDDENDYYDINSKGMDNDDAGSNKRSQRSRYNLMHKSRRDFKLALDFASRTVEFRSDQSGNKEQLLKGVNKLLDNSERRFPKNLFDGEQGKLIADIVNLIGNVDIRPPSSSSETKPRKKLIVANSDFLETVDQGMCLSMHQPWASLLVAGIKIHEGRTWKTDHRGRLWIAAAAQEPEDEDILKCEEMYKVLYNDPTIEFPKKYPTKCLLGCVVVDDCLDQKTYRDKFGEGGESSSPYVLICSNPIILPIFYPIQGQHKIFALPSDLHRTTKAALMSSKWF